MDTFGDGAIFQPTSLLGLKSEPWNLLQGRGPAEGQQSLTPCAMVPGWGLSVTPPLGDARRQALCLEPVQAFGPVDSLSLPS